MRADVARHLVGVGPGVLAQRPPDRFADEKLAVGQIRLDVRVQQVEVGLVLERELADDRHASLPQAGVSAPSPHQRSNRFWISAQQIPDHTCDLVHVVPPRAGDDQLLEHRHQIGLDALAVRLHPQQDQRRVALLAMASASPQLEDRLAPFGARHRRSVEHLAADRSDVGHVDPVVGHRRFHVRAHARGFFGVGRRLHVSAQPPNHGAGR